MRTDAATFASSPAVSAGTETSAPPALRRATFSRRVALTATGIAGVALGVLVGRDGTPGWQFARVVVVIACTAWVAHTIGRGAGRGWSGSVLGLLALVVGAGIGLPHAAKTGLTLVSVVGVALLLSGLCLLAVSAVTLLSPLRRWRRRVALPVGVLGVALLAWTLVPAVMATNVPPTSLGATTPADVGLAYEEVEFVAGDGVRLSAWYVPSSNGAAVVIRHGAGSTRSNVVEHAAVLAGGGYGVLLVDARGHGDSGGRAMDFGWYGDADIAASIDHLMTRSDVDPARIGVVGLSMGGEEALGALGADTRIRAAVAEGATGRNDADKAWLSDEFGVRGWLQEQLDLLRYATVDLLTAAAEPRSLASSIVAAQPRRVLLITAGTVAEEGLAARHLRSASPTTVSVWNVPGAGHTGGLRTDREGWERHVLTFLDDNLAGDERPDR